MHIRDSRNQLIHYTIQDAITSVCLLENVGLLEKKEEFELSLQEEKIIFNGKPVKIETWQCVIQQL